MPVSACLLCLVILTEPRSYLSIILLSSPAILRAICDRPYRSAGLVCDPLQSRAPIVSQARKPVKPPDDPVGCAVSVPIQIALRINDLASRHARTTRTHSPHSERQRQPLSWTKHRQIAAPVHAHTRARGYTHSSALSSPLPTRAGTQAHTLAHARGPAARPRTPTRTRTLAGTRGRRRAPGGYARPRSPRCPFAIATPNCLAVSRWALR